MFYTVGEIAKKMQVAPSTLRYYDKEGLLPNVERSGGGIRMFKDADVSWLMMIDCLKQTGMSIKDIKQFMDWCSEGDETIDKRLEIFRKQKESVERQMQELQDTMDMIDFKCWYYEQAQKAGTCKVHDNMTVNDIPERYRSIYVKKHQ